MSNTDGALNLIDLVKRFPTADADRAYLESLLWPVGMSSLWRRRQRWLN